MNSISVSDGDTETNYAKLKVSQTVKNPLAVQESWVRSLGQEDPWRSEWLPTSIFLPGEFHELRSLAGYSPWGCKELDLTK